MDPAIIKQLEDALVSADAAGNTEDAQVLADELRRVTGYGISPDTAQQPAAQVPAGMPIPPPGTAYAGLPMQPAVQPAASQPQEEQSWAGALGQRMLDAGKASLTGFNEMANAATFGATGLAQRHGAGLANAIEGTLRGDNKMTYAAGKEASDDLNAKRREEFPTAAFTGEVAGSVIPYVGAPKAIGMATKVASDAGKAVVADNSVGAMIGRLAAAAGFGAASNAAVQAGRSETSVRDLVHSGELGALFAAGGQAAGEAFEPIGKFIARKLGNEKLRDAAAMRRLAESFTDPRPGAGNMASALGRMTQDDALRGLFQDEALVGGPSKMAFGETSPDMLRAYLGKVEDGATIGLTKKTREMAERRSAELGAKIRESLKTNLMDAGKDPAQVAAEEAAKFSRAQDLFTDIFDSPQGQTAPVISKQSLLDMLYDTKDAAGKHIFDPGNASPSAKGTWGMLERAVKGTGVENSDDLTMAALQSIQVNEINPLAARLKNPSNSGEGLSARAANAVKARFNTLLEELDPRYATARAGYATQREAEAASDFGRNYISGNLKSHPIDNGITTLADLSPAQQTLAKKSAIDWLTGKLDQNPSFLKTLSGDNEAMAKRMEVMFGKDAIENATSVKDVLSDVAAMADKKGIYRDMLSAINRNVKQGSTSAATSGEQDLAHLGGIGLNVITGQPLASSNATKLRSLLHIDEEADAKAFMKLMQSDSDYNIKTLIDQMLTAKSAPKVSLLGGVIGEGAGRYINSVQEPTRAKKRKKRK